LSESIFVWAEIKAVEPGLPVEAADAGVDDDPIIR
jgi:hypothetical protein